MKHNQPSYIRSNLKSHICYDYHNDAENEITWKWTEGSCLCNENYCNEKG